MATMRLILSLLAALAICAPAAAQTTVQSTSKTVATCGSGVTYTAGKMNFPTLDTTGVLCTSAGGGGGGGSASFTAATTPFSVTAGVNKPAGISTFNSAQWSVPVKPGTTTEIDLTSALLRSIVGVNGTTIASAANPIPVAQVTSSAIIGRISLVDSGGGDATSTTAHASKVLNVDSTGTALDPNAPINCGPTSSFVQCMTLTGGTVGLVAGTAIAGKFGIDQTTDGTTNAVHLVAGTAIAGKVGVDQTTPGTTNAVAIKDTNNVAPDFTATVPTGAMVYPGKNVAGVFTIATPETCSSGNVANATVACTLAASSGKTTYITGFTMTGDGATVGLAVSCTLTGTISGTMTYTFGYPIGVAAPAQPLVVTFPFPVPASATNTTIVASCPASGTGGTNAAISATGFQL